MKCEPMSVQLASLDDLTDGGLLAARLSKASGNAGLDF